MDTPATDGTTAGVETFSDLDVAVAHWHIDSWGGAEYLVTKLADAVDAETVYTVGEPGPTAENPFGDVEFYDVTADLPEFSSTIRRHLGRPAEYGLWEDVDWRTYGTPDVLVTSGSTARGVITPDTTLHVNYCHSPPRWFYDLYHDRKDSVFGRLARPALRYLRLRDSAIDNRVDRYLANSPVIARRLWKYYKREAEVVYPPVDLDRYENRGDEGFYFHLGRLDSEKGIEAVVDAFDGLEQRIVFAGGDGDAGVVDRIRDGENMEYVGFVSEAEKYELLGTCRAVVFNGRNEDFGIVPVEANASGKPCLARHDGFPGMFVEDGTNGYLHDGSPASIRGAVSRLESDGLGADPTTFVDRFSLATFEETLQEHLLDFYGEFVGQFTVD